MLSSDLAYDIENPIPRREEDDVLSLYLNAEETSMAAKDCVVDEDSRHRALLFIVEYTINDPSVLCLATNYVDRCIGLISQSNVDVIALSCLTIASKMRDLNFTISQFLATHSDLSQFTAKEVAKTELTILEELKWHLRPVLPQSFIPFLTPKSVTSPIDEITLDRMIVNALWDVEFLKYKPSVVTAAALLAAWNRLYPEEMHMELKECSDRMISLCHNKLVLKQDLEQDLENEPQKKLRIQIGVSHQTAATIVEGKATMEHEAAAEEDNEPAARDEDNPLAAAEEEFTLDFDDPNLWPGLPAGPLPRPRPFQVYPGLQQLVPPSEFRCSLCGHPCDTKGDLIRHKVNNHGFGRRK